MALTEAELDAKRARANHLRSEIRSLRTDGTSARLEAERAVTADALDKEIQNLEREVLAETKGAGGSVDDAMEAMRRAEDLEKMLTPPKREEVPDEEAPTEEAAVVEPATESSIIVDERPSLETENGGNQ